MKRVVITGMYRPYEGPFDSDLDVWGVNSTYKIQEGLTRLYFMDPLITRQPEFIDDVNKLDIDVFAQRHYDEIPRSIEFPLYDVMRRFYGYSRTEEQLREMGYFTSTIAYMLAHAGYAGYEEVTIHRILALPPSIEYAQQKSCLDYWVGRLAGMGVNVRISSDSNIAKPMPWESGLYGYYKPDDTARVAAQTVTSAVRYAAANRGRWMEEAEVVDRKNSAA